MKNNKPNMHNSGSYNIMNDNLTDDLPLEDQEVHILRRSETVDIESLPLSLYTIPTILHPPIIMIPRSTSSISSSNSNSQIIHQHARKNDSSNGSADSSPYNSEYDDYIHETPRAKKTLKYKHLTYEEVEDSINKHVFGGNNKFSGEFELLITFVKGQKHIYAQSQRLINQRMYVLIVPILFISSTVSIIAPILTQVYFGGWIITIMNGFLTLLIAIMNKMNYSSIHNTYIHYENHYNRLETSLEMTKNQFLLIDDAAMQKQMILKKIQDAENRMMEIKEIFSVSIPLIIRTQTPIISNINIFSLFEKVENYKKHLIMNYKDVKNEIRYIMYKWDTLPTIAEDQKEKERVRLQYLLSQKDIIKGKLVDYRQAYVYVDELFSLEIKQSRQNLKSFFYSPSPTIPSEFNSSNPFVDNYLKFILSTH